MLIKLKLYYFVTNFKNVHCVKSVRIRKYSGPHFSRIFHIRTEYWEIRISPYSIYLAVFSSNAGKCGRNADKNNSEYEHFLRSGYHQDLKNYFSCMVPVEALSCHSIY